jgi:ABC-type multidrug transport system ATPase subunit
MDVIALRKRSGTISGQVRVNGFPQERVSFRRCSGYVEQFSVQSPELTVRETVIFSARLRLDRKYVETDERILAFADQVIKGVELTDLADSLVGSDEGVGLSFEQKKRLSIAVELAASPSIIFLDEVSERIMGNVVYREILIFLTLHFAFVHTAHQRTGRTQRALGCASAP